LRTHVAATFLFLGLVAGNRPVVSAEAVEITAKPLAVHVTTVSAAPGQHNTRPTWSPQETRLSFERRSDQGRELIISDTLGNIIKTLKPDAAGSDELDPLAPQTPDRTFNTSLSWAPDGQQFVFARSQNSKQGDLAVSMLADSEPHAVTDGESLAAQPAWSPQGDRIAFITLSNDRPQLSILRLSDGVARTLASNGESVSHPRWSPGGTALATTVGDTDRHDIARFDLKPGKHQPFRHLTENGKDNLVPSWSPDGRKIAFYCNMSNNDTTDDWALLVMDANSKMPLHAPMPTRNIVAHHVVPDWEKGPAWMPDSRNLVYVQRDRHAFDPIVVTNMHSHRSRRLETRTRLNRDIAVSRNGRIAFSAQDGNWSGIYIADIGHGKL